MASQLLITPFLTLAEPEFLKHFQIIMESSLIKKKILSG